jgi:hypothetical protein
MTTGLVALPTRSFYPSFALLEGQLSEMYVFRAIPPTSDTKEASSLLDTTNTTTCPLP